MVALIYLYFILNLNWAIDPANISQNEIYQANLIKMAQNNIVEFESLSPDDFFKNALKNHKSENFPLPEFLTKDIKFWFYIYALFDKNYTVFHHKNNLEIIYDIVDYGDLKSSDLNSTVKELIRTELLKKKLALIRENLNSKSVDELIKLYPSLAYVKKLKAKKRKSHLRYLAKNIRYQGGLKDEVMKAIDRSKPFLPHAIYILNKFDLPKELLAIPFVESSFNPKATSKAGAKGVWQIMPSISKKLLPKAKIDYRLNPIISTIAAGQLLTQTFQITKSWSLSVIGYHSGLRGIMKYTIKRARSNLEGYLRSINATHAFATRNYLSEFYAMNLVLENLKTLSLSAVDNQFETAIPTYLFVRNCSKKFNISRIFEHEKMMNIANGQLVSSIHNSHQGFELIDFNKKTFLAKDKTILKYQSCSTK